MIFNALIGVAWILLDFLLLLLPTIPLFPSNFENHVISGITLLMDNGLSIIKLFVDYPVIVSCLTVVGICYGLIFTYSVIKFVLYKIPLLDIH